VSASSINGSLGTQSPWNTSQKSVQPQQKSEPAPKGPILAKIETAKPKSLVGHLNILA
jgi:hypothetical protein